MPEAVESGMERSDIEKRVVDVVCQALDVDKDMVQPDSNFIFDLGAESTQSIQLVAAFEEAFSIEMDDEAALNVQTVGEAVEFIAEYVDK